MNEHWFESIRWFVGVLVVVETLVIGGFMVALFW